MTNGTNGELMMTETALSASKQNNYQFCENGNPGRKGKLPLNAGEETGVGGDRKKLL